MPKKQLIVAGDVRAAAKSGQSVIHLSDKTAIVTSEARSLAKDLGIELRLAEPTQPGAAAEHSGSDEAAVRRAIASHTGGPASEALIGEVMRRVELERTKQRDSQIRKIAAISDSPRTENGNANLSQLDLSSLMAGTAAPRAAGFIAWSKSVSPFIRHSDEINLVLEGELQFRVGQDLISARAGDVMWIPKGAQGEIGTPTSVRFFYLSYTG